MASVLAAVVCWIRTDKEHVIPFIFWHGCYKEDYRLCIYGHIFHSVWLYRIKVRNRIFYLFDKSLCNLIFNTIVRKKTEIPCQKGGAKIS